MIPVQVLIVEDDPMTRTLFEIFIKESGRYAVAGSIESASMAELFCLTRKVDLIIMDVCTALHASGLLAAEKIISSKVLCSKIASKQLLAHR